MGRGIEEEEEAFYMQVQYYGTRNGTTAHYGSHTYRGLVIAFSSCCGKRNASRLRSRRRCLVFKSQRDNTRSVIL